MRMDKIKDCDDCPHERESSKYEGYSYCDYYDELINSTSSKLSKCKVIGVITIEEG